MSDLTFFALSLACGVAARLLFLPASLVAKRCGKVPAFFTDFACAVLGSVPFTVLLFVFRDGVGTYYSLAALYAGMLLPTLVARTVRVVARKKGKTRRNTDETAPRA